MRFELARLSLAIVRKAMLLAHVLQSLSCFSCESGVPYRVQVKDFDGQAWNHAENRGFNPQAL